MSVRGQILQAFPEGALADEAFADVCFPLCRLAMKKLDPTLSGWATWFYTLEDPYRKDAVFGPGCSPDGRLSYTQTRGRASFLIGRDFFDVRQEWEPHVEATRAAWAARKPISTLRKFPIRWGGSPKWLQSDETPRNEHDRKLVFIGQVSSMSFLNAPVAKSLFLFYDPTSGRLTQVAQVT